MKNVLKLLAKSVLIPFRLTARHQQQMKLFKRKFWDQGIFRTWITNVRLPRMTTLTISNEEMNDIIKIVKSLEKSAFLMKGVSETIQSEAI